MDQLDEIGSAKPRTRLTKRVLFFFIAVCLIGCLIAAILIGIQTLTGNARGMLLSVIALSAAVLYTLIVVSAFVAITTVIVLWVTKKS